MNTARVPDDQIACFAFDQARRMLFKQWIIVRHVDQIAAHSSFARGRSQLEEVLVRVRNENETACRLVTVGQRHETLDGASVRLSERVLPSFERERA